jgi:hypothetical protein
MAPWGCLKNATRPVNKRLSQVCGYVSAEICQKTALQLTHDSPPQQKGPNKKPPCVNSKELLIFWDPCSSLGTAFPFSLINPTLCADLVVS